MSTRSSDEATVPQGCPKGMFRSLVGLRKALINMEPAIGFEPMTCALRMRCSTAELRRLCLTTGSIQKEARRDNNGRGVRRCDRGMAGLLAAGPCVLLFPAPAFRQPGLDAEHGDAATLLRAESKGSGPPSFTAQNCPDAVRRFLGPPPACGPCHRAQLPAFPREHFTWRWSYGQHVRAPARLRTAERASGGGTCLPRKCKVL
jgi:hypothetical protein